MKRVFHITANKKRLNFIHYTGLFELKFSGKMSEEKYVVRLGPKANPIALISAMTFNKMSRI